MKIGDAMVKNVVFVDYSTKILEVCKIMGEKRIGSVIVLRSGKPYGIFTERDLLSKVFLEGKLEEEVGKYASSPLVVVSPDYDVREAVKIMRDLKIRRLVVSEGDKIVGILTASDIVKLLGEGKI
ncbi:MAG: CBS domain-containing protein [Archaeoglobaceae archaeon]|nr:CBS domain-containing protein [Archaeoglobaceae archaeon]MCX8151518.1 CBS domain-containing protein [Archaeoglobaceae archaeon]MDW8013246.1 CBS domain-containing protein [Archaeoglobaceae archaeon]